MARNGAPHGTVLIAGHQSGGRGRMGRCFQSPAGLGVYLSVILRPGCAPEKLMHLTCAAGVAMTEAIRQVAGITPGLKWINDLVYDKKKLGGILTELAIEPKTGLTDYAIIGIGINCRQTPPDFPPELQSMATSLSAIIGMDIDCAAVAAAMVEALWKTDKLLLSHKTQLMDDYRSLCITLGQQVSIHSNSDVRYAKAIALDDDGGLIVAFDDGHVQTVNSGEVSVRGMYGYI